MWSRKELKKNAKKRVSQNYWRCVLAAFIMIFLIGGSGGGSSTSYKSGSLNKLMDEDSNGGMNFDDFVDEFEEKIDDYIDSDKSSESDVKFGDVVDDMEDAFNTPEARDKISEAFPIIGTIAVVALIIVLIIVVISVCTSVFLLNPLLVGGRKFFMENHRDKGMIGEFGHAFSTNYKNITLTMFLMKLYIALWTLLFIIPGIIKNYEYRMIPYLLADNPDIDRNDAFLISKEMMRGNKWNAFVLDLSFIGWYLLNILTCGLLSIFYINPYVRQTEAELYFALKGEDTASFDNAYEAEVVTVE